jgi:hypothetical protein
MVWGFAKTLDSNWLPSQAYKSISVRSFWFKLRALCPSLCPPSLSLSLSLSIHPLLKNKLRVSSLQTRFSFSSRFIGSSRSSLWVSCIWVSKQQTWCTQCRTLSPCSAQLMGSGRLASMPMRSCPHSCPTTLQRVFFCKDMASLVASASLRWDLVWPTSTDCTDTTSHQICVLAACNLISDYRSSLISTHHRAPIARIFCLCGIVCCYDLILKGVVKNCSFDY